MSSIDRAVRGLVSRLKESPATIREIAEAGEVSVGAVWRLRRVNAPSEANFRLAFLRGVERGLSRLQKRSAPPANRSTQIVSSDAVQ